MISDGLLLVDKPGGMTSHDVVAFFRRALSRKDIGHAGTLDPMATGLLVLLVGKATKLSDFILNGEKVYHNVVRLGVTTDTDDITGEVLSEKPVDVTDEQLSREIEKLTGDLELPVPIYSAIKVKGKKLYEKARKGEDFVPPMRPMSFDDLTWERLSGNQVEVSFLCKKGSYVRAWGKALGEALGCGATVETLRRTESKPYSVKHALTPEQIQSLSEEELENSTAWVPLNQTLPDWPLVKVDGQDEKLIRNGQIPRKLERFLELEYGQMQGLQGLKVASRRSSQLICLLSFIPPLSFKIRRVFPNQ